MVEPTVAIAFGAGLLSFASPCILPLVPGYIGYLSGIGIEEAETAGPRLRARLFLHSLLFVLGFTLVFASFGALLNSLLSSVSYDARIWAGRIGGTVVIAFGLHLTGLLEIPGLMRARQVNPTRKGLRRGSLATSVAFGAAFAVGWTPCVGVILGSILTLAALNPGTAFAMLVAYSLGLGLPFLAAGLFTASFTRLLTRTTRWRRPLSIGAGIFLIGVGILVFTNTLNLLANFFVLDSLLQSPLPQSR
ncbi:MAG: sulfite exporter TauE/SafE family protein [Euryarchaeota archaeon]|nr:sulfite exporter TauE/SafE family protein [Euryarchaeota archaeon]